MAGDCYERKALTNLKDNDPEKRRKGEEENLYESDLSQTLTFFPSVSASLILKICSRILCNSLTLSILVREKTRTNPSPVGTVR